MNLEHTEVLTEFNQSINVTVRAVTALQQAERSTGTNNQDYALRSRCLKPNISYNMSANKHCSS